jgi:hypothetical protein
VLLPWSNYPRPARRFLESEGNVYAIGQGFLSLGDNRSASELREHTINDICSWQGAILVATDGGVFELAENRDKTIAKEFQPMTGYHRRASTFFPFGSNELYIATQDGLFALRGNRMQWPEVNAEINDITSSEDGAIWTATDDGLRTASPDTINMPASDVTRVVSYQKCIWAASSDGLIICESTNSCAKLSTYHANDLAVVDGRLLMAASTGLYELTRDTHRGDRLPDQIVISKLSPKSCLRLFVSGSFCMTLCSDGAYEFVSSRLREQAVVGSSVIVHSIREIDGQKWVLTSNGAFLVSDGTQHRVTPADLECFDAFLFKNTFLLGTARGLFAFFENGKLQLNITQEPSKLLTLLLHFLKRVYVTGPSRLQANYWAPELSLDGFINSRGLNPEFKAIVASTQRDIEDLAHRDQWQALEAISPRLSLGANDLQVRIRDQWGNELHESRTLWAFPQTGLMSAIVTSVAVTFLLFCFLTYPWFGLSRRILFNPFLNTKWLGLVPLIVSLCRPARKYLFVLYSRTLANRAALRLSDPTTCTFLNQLLTNEIVEQASASSLINIIVKVQGDRPNLSTFTLRLIQKLFFEIRTPQTAKFVAIFLDMIVHGDKTLAQTFDTTLESYGGIDNSALNDKLLSQDGYHFFICTDRPLPELPGFIDEHEQGNQITVVSDSILSGFEGLNIKTLIVNVPTNASSRSREH